MKIGVCGGIERAPIVKGLGYDFIEENMAKITALSEKDFAERVKKYEKLDFSVYSFNCFFNGEISLYGKNSLADVREYASRALLRARELGGKICVIGSGKARAMPDGVSREFAENRFCDIVSLCGELADSYGIKIAIEPLNSKETNFINTVGEAADIVKRAGNKNVGTLVDFFHFFMENEDDGGVINNADTLIHAHIARPDSDRCVPQKGDEPTVRRWAELIKNIGYTGAISVEARFVNFEDEIKECKEYVELFR